MAIKTLRVKASTNVKSLAGSIAHVVTDKNSSCEISCIGAGAVNQAVKGIAIARSMLATNGYDLVARHAFDTVGEGEEQVTRIKFVLLLI